MTGILMGMTAIACRTLLLTLDDRGRAVSLRDRESSYEFLAAQSQPVGLWQMGAMRPVAYADPLPAMQVPDAPYEGHEWFANRDEYRADLELDSDDVPAPAIRAAGDRTELTWAVPMPGGTGTVALTIDGGAGDRLEFRGRVALPAGWALKRLTFPRIRGLGDPRAPADDALLFPESWGVLRRNPLEDMTAYSGQYPGHANWCQMAAWLHGDRGVYVGVLDPSSSHTGIDLQYVEGGEAAPLDTDRRNWHGAATPAMKARTPLSQRVRPAMQLRCHHWPAMTAAWTSAYPVVLQGFAGDWYAAAQIHRGWATTQRWCGRGRLAERGDASAALAGIDLWFSGFGFHPTELVPQPAPQFQQAMERLAAYFQMPFGVHWYHWHAFSWHRNFPGHTPPVEGFAAAVTNLQQRGIVVMPYAQGRLLYRDRPQFEAERTHAAVGAGGQPYPEQYTAQDDWPVALCPGAAWSGAQWHEAARMLWQDYGVDGVYFDQIAGMPPLLCYHSGHGHAPGGGNHWWRGYAAALAAMEPLRAQQPRRFLASELMADAYLDRIDLYLAFVPALEDFVPLHAAIYGGYTTVMGRSTPPGVMADAQLFAISQGEQLLFGGQLGWLSEEILRHPEAASYLRDLARLRARLRPYLHYGTLEAPLALRQDARLTRRLPAHLAAKPRPVAIDRPAVRHSVWRAPNGARLVLLLNESRADATVEFRLPAPGDWQVTRLGSTIATPVAPDVTLTLRGLEVAAFTTGDQAP